MTIAKARLYRTAQVTDDTGVELPDGVRRGEYVSVRYLGPGASGRNFACKNTDGLEFCLDEYSLEHFVP